MFVNHLQSLLSLGNADLPRPLRRSVALTAARLALVKIATAVGLPRSLLPNPLNIAGFKVSYFHLHQITCLFREIFLNAQYLFQADVDQPFIVDCGSNIGLSILFFKRLYPKAHVIGFEPDPDTFSILQKNIEQNHLTGVDLYQCALGDEEGSVNFFHNHQEKGSLMMSIHRERLEGERIEVPARLLSSFVTREVDLLKMDIEGSETVVLPELVVGMKLSNIKQIHLEYHHHIKQCEDNLSAILRLFESNNFGYRITANACHGKLPAVGIAQDISIYAYRKQNREAPRQGN